MTSEEVLFGIMAFILGLIVTALIFPWLVKFFIRYLDWVDRWFK